jgi:hypothetical protein
MPKKTFVSNVGRVLYNATVISLEKYLLAQDGKKSFFSNIGVTGVSFGFIRQSLIWSACS